MKKLLYIFVLLLGMSLVTSCSIEAPNVDGTINNGTSEDGGSTPSETYTITYNVMGVGDDVNVVLNTTAIPNPLPVISAAGYEFKGWYMDVEFTQEATPGASISSDIILYAKWVKVTETNPMKLSIPNVTISDTGLASWDAVEHATSYVYLLNGEKHNTSELSVQLEEGDSIQVRALSTDEEYIDSEYSQEKVYSISNEIYTITFVVEGYDKEIEVVEASKIPSQLPSIVMEGYTFDGWYTDSKRENEVVLGQVINQNITLYGFLDEASVDGIYNLSYVISAGDKTLMYTFKETHIPETLPIIGAGFSGEINGLYHGFAWNSWYTDTAFKTQAVQGAKLTADTKLYLNTNYIVEEIEYNYSISYGGVSIEDYGVALFLYFNQNPINVNPKIDYVNGNETFKTEFIYSLKSLESGNEVEWDGLLYGKDVLLYILVKQESELIDGMLYEISEDKTYYIITQANPQVTNVEILREVNGKPVKAIDSSAFYNCANLTSIVIPKEITIVGSSAFEYEYCYARLTIYCEASEQPNGWQSNWNSGRPVYWGIAKEDIIQENEMQFLIINDEAVLTRYIGNDMSVNIPSSINKNGISYNVTSVGDYAFSGCKSLLSIIIPDQVTSVGKRAFSECHGLTIYCEASKQPSGWDEHWNYYDNLVYWGIKKEDLIEENGIQYLIIDGEAVLTNYVGNNPNIIVPSNVKSYIVTSVGGRAFSGDNLITVTFAEGSQLISIGEYAFSYCYSLTSIEIPSSVTSIGDCAFYDCNNLTTVTFAEGSQLISIGAGAFCDCNNLTSIEIPEGVINIGNHAFDNCENLETIELPSTLTCLGDYAFSDCTKLAGIFIPEGVTNLDSSTFGYCSRLKFYCEASKQPSGWDEYWNYYDNPVYWGIKKEDIIEENEIQYLIIDGEAVLTNYVGNNPNIIVPSNVKSYIVTSVGGRAFSGDNLITVTFAEGSQLISIGEYAFSYCYSLTSIEIPSSVTSIGEESFYSCYSLTSIMIDDENEKYKSIDGNLYSKDGATLIQYAIGKKAETFEIPSSVTIIGAYAFSHCYNLISIEIPSSVTIIGDRAFYDCNNLTTVTFAEGSQLTIIGDRAFYDCDNLTVYYGGTVKEFFNITIENKYEFTSATIYLNGELPGENGKYKIIDDNLYSKDGATLFQYAIGKKDETSEETFEIPSSVTIIGDRAFYDCNNLISIEIPSSVTIIGEEAFFHCDSLTSIEIPSSVTIIGDRAFYDCNNLTTVTFAEGSQLTFIGEEAFYSHFSSLTSIEIPSSVTIIGDRAFYDCDNLTTVTFAEGSQLISIGEESFYSCYSLTSIEIPSSVTSIGEEAFFHCDSLTSIMIDDENEKYKSIDGNLYSKDGATLIQYAIGKKAETFEIPSSVTIIGDRAFYDCDNLITVTFAEGSQLISIGEYAFSYCDSLTSIEIPEGVTSIGEYAFQYCNDLTTVIFEEGSQQISIGRYAFSYCNSSFNVYYEGTNESWNDVNIFDGNWNLTNATIYYYSEIQPTEEGNYWHYDSDGNAVKW